MKAMLMRLELTQKSTIRLQWGTKLGDVCQLCKRHMQCYCTTLVLEGTVESVLKDGLPVSMIKRWFNVDYATVGFIINAIKRH